LYLSFSFIITGIKEAKQHETGKKQPDFPFHKKQRKKPRLLTQHF